MKKEQLYEAIGDMKDTYLQEARSAEADCKAEKTVKSKIKWFSAAACLVIVIVSLSVSAIRRSHRGIDLPATEIVEATEETAFGTRYVYKIDSGAFAPYVGGKVIESEFIGEKLEDVTVTAGWITDPSQAPADESLRGEIYAIKDISPDLAVALWFLDKGEALTTTHYYVILNPEADLSPLADYVIPDYVPDPMEE